MTIRIKINQLLTKGLKMMYLIQILNMLNDKQLLEFEALFDDLSFEIKELGWQPEELVNDMLINHFGIEMEVELQLKTLTSCIMVKSHQNLINLEKLKRGIGQAG